MPSLAVQLLILCPLTFLGGFVDSIAGGGGLITLPAYYAAGLPYHTVLGSNKFSASLATLTASVRFIRNRQVHLPSLLPAVPAALIGSALGARLALVFSEDALQYFLLAFLPVLAVFLLTRKDITDYKRRDLPRRVLIPLSALTGLVIGTYDGFFGPGTGTFLTLAFTGILGIELLPAIGNSRIINLCSNLGSLFTFLITGKVYFAAAVPAAGFALLGSFIGSGLALSRGSKIVRPMLVVVLVLLLGKVAYDIFSPVLFG